MPHLTLTLLGPPRIKRDGQPVSLDTRKAVALLAYLAVTGQRHSRDALAALLYPDFDQSRARATLRRTLSSLKSAIGDLALEIAREFVALAPDAGLWCDVTEFQRLLGQCQGHGHGAHDVCARCLAPLHEATALYQGDFLAGFTLRDSAVFDDWQRFETERLRRELLSALERLVRLLTTEGDLAAAIEQAQRLLAIDPLHEPAHRVLMLLYVWTGQEQAVLRQYRACVRALNEELGVAPLPETTQVYEAIKERRTPPPPARLHAAAAKNTSQPAANRCTFDAPAPDRPGRRTGRAGGATPPGASRWPAGGVGGRTRHRQDAAGRGVPAHGDCGRRHQLSGPLLRGRSRSGLWRLDRRAARGPGPAHAGATAAGRA